MEIVFFFSVDIFEFNVFMFLIFGIYKGIGLLILDLFNLKFRRRFWIFFGFLFKSLVFSELGRFFFKIFVFLFIFRFLLNEWDLFVFDFDLRFE